MTGKSWLPTCAKIAALGLALTLIGLWLVPQLSNRHAWGVRFV